MKRCMNWERSLKRGTPESIISKRLDSERKMFENLHNYDLRIDTSVTKDEVFHKVSKFIRAKNLTN